MNTSNLSSLRPPVGQLAKTPIFRLKTNESKALEVGRHQNQTPRTSERTHEGELEVQNTTESGDFNALIYLNNLLADLLPDMKVCYHNTLYVQQIEETYSVEESTFFLQLVKTFAQFRQTDRTEPLQNILLTNENDFLQAFKLLQQHKIKTSTNLKPKTIGKAFDLLKIKFQNRTFSTFLLTKELYYSYKVLNQIITVLLLERKIEFVKEMNGQLFYRLHTKTPIHYVAGK